MDRRHFLRLTRSGLLLAAAGGALAACSTDMPPEAVAAWAGPGPQDEADPRRWVLAHAILAPHSHNLQSWLVDLSRPEVITLYLDRERLLPQTDPLSRQMLMSQGTFLEVLDLAARERGLRAEIELFPEGVFGPDTVDDRPTARIRLRPDPEVRPDPLFAQVRHRRTNREPYAPTPPRAEARQAIAAAAQASGVTLQTGFVTEAEGAAMAEHRRLAKEAWRIELVTPRTILESYHVLRVGPSEIAQHRDGLSINDPMVRALSALGLFDRRVAPGPDDAATTGQIRRFNAAIDATPAFFWLVSEGNDRVSQVQAGRAWVRAQLAATAQGLAMQPISQALQEYPEQAAMLRAIHAQVGATRPGQTVQMWARLGEGPAIGPAPRRGLAAHLRSA